MKEQQVAVPKWRPPKYSRLRKPCSEQERVKVGMLTSGIAQLNVLPEDLGSTARAWPHWPRSFSMLMGLIRIRVRRKNGFNIS